MFSRVLAEDDIVNCSIKFRHCNITVSAGQTFNVSMKSSISSNSILRHFADIFTKGKIWITERKTWEQNQKTRLQY